MRRRFQHKPYPSPLFEDSGKKSRPTPIQKARTFPKTVYFEVKDFPHLHYLYTMTRGFYLRMQNIAHMPQSGDISPEEPVIRMTLDGDWNLEKLRMFNIDASCSSTARELCKPVWPSSPILYYQFETQSVSEILWTFRKERMQSSRSNRVVVIVSRSANAVPEFMEDGNTFIVRNSTELRDLLTHVLEIPLSDRLKETDKMLREGKGNEDLEKSSTEWLLEEVRTLQSMIKTSKNDLTEIKTDAVIPPPLTDYLYRKRNVIAFGIWRRKQFHVFVKDMSETRQLEHCIQYFGGDFFNEVDLVFISDSMNFKIQMRQGDKLYTQISTKCKNVEASSHHPATSSSVEEHYGTLGAFVKNSNTGDALALTCGHVYSPNTADNIAYARPTEDSDPCRIGTCIFSTLPGNEKFIDFAVIKIDNEMKDKCDMVLRNAMDSRCRTILYTDKNLSNVNMVHKKGAKSQLTSGKIEYSRYHSKLFQGRKEVFLVSGFGKKFSQPGDSGSVVFCHDSSSEQNCIYAVGMVSHGEIDDREENNSSDDPDLSVCFRLSDAFSMLEEGMPQLKPLFAEFVE